MLNSMAGMESDYTGFDILPVRLKARSGDFPSEKHYGTEFHTSLDAETANVASLATQGTTLSHAEDSTAAEDSIGRSVADTAAARALRVCNNSSFTNFCDPVRLVGGKPCNTSSFGTYAVEHNKSIEFLDFKVDKSESQSLLVLPTGSRVWLSMEDWLRSLPASTSEVPTDDEGYSQQFQWWQENGKSFPLLDLPAELLRTMLLHLLGTTAYCPDCLDFFRKSVYFRGFLDKRGYEFHVSLPLLPSEQRTRPENIPPVNEAVMLLNRFTHQVATEVLAEDTVKVVCQPHLFRKLLCSRSPELDLACLRHVKLCMGYNDFFSFFLVNVHRDPGIFASYDAGLLARLPQLRSLELYFDALKADFANPWSSADLSNRGRKFTAGRLPCQKVLADWILAYAYRYLRLVPEVKLSGYIKTSVRQKWERILGSSRRGESDAEVEKLIACIETLAEDANEVPPRCYCSKRCCWMDVELNTFQRSAICPAPFVPRHGRPMPTRAELDHAFSRWVFDFDDCLDDGRLDEMKQLERSEEDDDKYARIKVRNDD